MLLSFEVNLHYENFSCIRFQNRDELFVIHLAEVCIDGILFTQHAKQHQQYGQRSVCTHQYIYNEADWCLHVCWINVDQWRLAEEALDILQSNENVAKLLADKVL